jgi:peptidoglycan hydrolase-like protein with peptidoglycan-binding domain
LSTTTYPSPIRRWRLTAILSGIVLGFAATITGTSTAAFAATPQCSTQHGFHYTDVNGDKLLGVASPSYIDYTAWAPAARYSDGSYRWSCLLAKGAHGTAVYELQSEINDCYSSSPQWGGVKLGLHLAEDGDFGPATKTALIKIQQYHKITADGVYGPQTALAMRHSAWANSGDIGTGTFCHTLGG